MKTPMIAMERKIKQKIWWRKFHTHLIVKVFIFIPRVKYLSKHSFASAIIFSCCFFVIFHLFLFHLFIMMSYFVKENRLSLTTFGLRQRMVESYRFSKSKSKSPDETDDKTKPQKVTNSVMTWHPNKTLI